MSIATVHIQIRYSAGSTYTEILNNSDNDIIVYFDGKKQTLISKENHVFNGVSGLGFATVDGTKFNCAAVTNSLGLGNLPSLTIYRVNEKREFVTDTINMDIGYSGNITITMNTEMPSTICNKTSSRLGGVIRRVKNRISNLCENRMEVAYGVV